MVRDANVKGAAAEKQLKEAQGKVGSFAARSIGCAPSPVPFSFSSWAAPRSMSSKQK